MSQRPSLIERVLSKPITYLPVTAACLLANAWQALNWGMGATFDWRFWVVFALGVLSLMWITLLKFISD